MVFRPKNLFFCVLFGVHNSCPDNTSKQLNQESIHTQKKNIEHKTTKMHTLLDKSTN